MNLVREHPAESGSGSRDHALSRIVTEIRAGLRHGYFDLRVTGDVIGQGRRRLILHAGRNYQFLIPAAECEAPEGTTGPCMGAWSTLAYRAVPTIRAAGREQNDRFMKGSHDEAIQ
jgi:hypothetical protein